MLSEKLEARVQHHPVERARRRSAPLRVSTPEYSGKFLERPAVAS